MNYMKEVAKMLGVEIGEGFYINTHGDFEFVFTENGLFTMHGSAVCNNTLNSLLSGTAFIKRKPCKPEDGDEFYYVDYAGYPVHFCTKGCDPDDYLNYYKLGNCYRTKKEAEANSEKWKAFYASDEVLEV